MISILPPFDENALKFQCSSSTKWKKICSSNRKFHMFYERFEEYYLIYLFIVNTVHVVHFFLIREVYWLPALCCLHVVYCRRLNIHSAFVILKCQLTFWVILLSSFHCVFVLQGRKHRYSQNFVLERCICKWKPLSTTATLYRRATEECIWQ